MSLTKKKKVGKHRHMEQNIRHVPAMKHSSFIADTKCLNKIIQLSALLFDID